MAACVHAPKRKRIAAPAIRRVRDFLVRTARPEGFRNLLRCADRPGGIGTTPADSADGRTERPGAASRTRHSALTARDQPLSFSLIVTDTSPLITLAVADSLESLLRINPPIRIPDAVYAEATRNRTAAAASRIAAWIDDNPDQVRIVPPKNASGDQDVAIRMWRSGCGDQENAPAKPRAKSANNRGGAPVASCTPDVTADASPRS